jgi:hypothetical protein
MRPPTTAKPVFRATHYDVSATLTPATRLIVAHALVEFQASDVSSTVIVELHPNMKVASVTLAGKPQSFDRDQQNPLQLRVTLNEPVGAAQKVTLNFEYSGLLSNEENSPVPGVRLAAIGTDGIYLLLPSRWFPLTDFPSNRYTATFKLQVPEAFLVAGTGKPGAVETISDKAPLPAVIKPGAPPPAPTAQKAYSFRDDKEEASGSFVAAPYKLTPVNVGGIKISVYTFPRSTQTAQLYGQDAAKIITDFSEEFGALPDPGMTIAEFPDLSISGFSGPGLALVSQRQWEPRGNTRLLSRLIGAQWFGVSVMPASPADVWVTDGLARYCEAIYAGQGSGKETMDRTVEDFTVGALMYEDAAPISQSETLKPYTSQYLSIVEDKGAAVFHMLRSIEGDEMFRALLQAFYSRYAGKNARITDFEALAQQYMDLKSQGKAAPVPVKISPNTPPPAPPPSTHSLTPFFAQWLSSTGVPEFVPDFVVYRTPKGFQVVGKITQSLDTLSMPLEVTVETEGDPESRTIQVIGTETPFSIDTFGRPKPQGLILDPHDHVLKSNPGLRIRAIIARGEAQAEQGHYLQAIEEYQRALDVQKNNALAEFRMGEAFFYQKNYTAAANSFRSAIGGETDLSTKWVATWSHIYMGMIYDITGQRERAVNEYRLATQGKDNTGGAQEVAAKYLATPYKDN